MYINSIRVCQRADALSKDARKNGDNGVTSFQSVLLYLASKEIGNGVGMVARKEVEQDAREKAEGTG